MSNNQQQLIKQYFQSLVDQFITDPKHKDISFVFADFIKKGKSGDILGNTNSHRSGGGSETTWQKYPDGSKVPGSEKTTYFPYVYKYTITFLNHYENEEKLRGTVTHEFSHLYLFSTVEDHDHDDRFYSHMEKFEN